MDIKLTHTEASHLHGWMQILPLLASATIPFEAKQKLAQDAIEDEALQCVAQKLNLQLLEAKPETEIDLAATLDRLSKQQRDRDYARGWVLFHLEKEIAFATLTQEQWKTIAEELEFDPGWAWHQHQKYFK